MRAAYTVKSAQRYSNVMYTYTFVNYFRGCILWRAKDLWQTAHYMRFFFFSFLLTLFFHFSFSSVLDSWIIRVHIRAAFRLARFMISVPRSSRVHTTIIIIIIFRVCGEVFKYFSPSSRRNPRALAPSVGQYVLWAVTLPHAEPIVLVDRRCATPQKESERRKDNGSAGSVFPAPLATVQWCFRRMTYRRVLRIYYRIKRAYFIHL